MSSKFSECSVDIIGIGWGHPNYCDVQNLASTLNEMSVLAIYS